MRYIFIILLFSLFLNASNPKVYSVLGDTIYNNVEKINHLTTIKEYKIYKEEIEKYVQEVSKIKKMGFAIDSLSQSKLKKEYLTNLRKLSKQNDFFIRTVQLNYNNAFEDENSLLFSDMINSGLLDTQKNKKEIIGYYLRHSDEINASGLIQSYLDNDAQLNAKKDKILAKQKTKKIREKEKIQRIRANDIKAQRTLEVKLQKELNQKKLEIQENQKKELTQ